MIGKLLTSIKSKKLNFSNIKNYFYWNFINLIDRLIDLKITGIDLTRTVPSMYCDTNNGVGMTDSQPTRYFILEKVFKNVSLKKSDVFIDVGCGKGRVLAFLLKCNYPCQLYGVELSEQPYGVARKWTKDHNNIQIILSDAMEIDYNRYTVLYLSRPFLPITFLKFIELLESQLTHSIKLIYVFDQESGYLLENRTGWNINLRESIDKIHGLSVCIGKQWYSIWTYNPSNQSHNVKLKQIISG